jgi:hypothetical protein
MNIKKFVKSQNMKFIKGFELINNTRGQWTDFENRVKSTYQPLIDELKENFKFEYFYLHTRKELTHESNNTNQNFIQFYMGNHPVGVVKNEHNPETGKIKKIEFLVENGGTLLFTQSPRGEVIVLIYPCKSDVIKYDDEHLVYKIFKNPCGISTKHLTRIIKFYFNYVYITSYLGKANIFNRLRIMWIKFRVGFDILKFGKAIFEATKTSVEIISGVSGIPVTK